MSTGAECVFVELEPDQWYYDLQDWPYGEWPDFVRYGPFPSYDEAGQHLRHNHANPGGSTFVRFTEGKPYQPWYEVVKRRL